ncbi:MAG: alpha/beta fold hydrolase [Candidatus Porifericomitaceae bacterium WSBS_2022_MAG_OTU9]
MSQYHGKTVSFIHGWSIDSGIYKKLAAEASAFAEVVLIDLPGYGAQQHAAKQALSAKQISRLISAQIPNGSTVVAWSMGALPALYLAAEPGRIKSLCMLAANPCFCRREDWFCAVEPQHVFDMGISMAADRDKCLKKFCATASSNSPKDIMYELRSCQGRVSTPVLQQGLELLRLCDARDQLAKAACPVEVVLGDKDPLIPVEVGAALMRWQPAIKVHVFAGCGHVPFLSHGRQTLEILHRMVA